MYWLIIFLIEFLDVGWLVDIQEPKSFSNIQFVVLVIFLMVLSLVLFLITLKNISISHTYLVCLAISAISISIKNHYFLNQLYQYNNRTAFV